MGKETEIQWTDSTWNPWTGCSKVSPGCAHCYMFEWKKRYGQKGTMRKMTSPANWRLPLKWDKEVADAIRLRRDDQPMPRRPKIFPSLCDWLDDGVVAQWLADFLSLIRRTPRLDWLLLTKRPERWVVRLKLALMRARDFEDSIWIANWLNGDAPPNVWVGVSVENQEWADMRIPVLATIPARLRFISAEPLLGAVDLKLSPFCVRANPENYPGATANEIDWVIVGGESGPGARVCNVEWIRSVLSQCRSATVPCFVKQLGSRPERTEPMMIGGHGDYAVKLKHKKGGDPSEWPANVTVREWPK